MCLIFFLDIVQDSKSFFLGGGLDHNFLEPAFKSAVLFNVLAVFIVGGSTNALDLAASECRFEHIGGIHGAWSAAGPYNGVYLVNKQDDIGILGEFVEHGFYAFFKLSAVFCASDHRRHVEGDNAFVKEYAGHFSLDNAEGQTFDNG